MSTTETVVAIFGLAGITLLTRGFFLMPEKEVPIPAWLREALRFAPLAALVAVVAPEIVLTNGELIHTWRDARLFGVAAATAWYAWRRTLLGTIVCGTSMTMLLRLGLGW
jgi:branched-subunit amino acid transport protein